MYSKGKSCQQLYSSDFPFEIHDIIFAKSSVSLPFLPALISVLKYIDVMLLLFLFPHYLCP